MTVKQVHKFSITKVSACALMILLLQGCATADVDVSKLPGTEKLVELSESAKASKASMDALNEEIKKDPAASGAWVKMAQAKFEANDYPGAIEAANRAVELKASGSEAKSILFVASMRLAMQTLSQIRSESQLSGSTRTEAETLVESLRQTLGQPVLLPAVATPGNTDDGKQHASTGSREPTRKKIRKSATSKPAVTKPATAPAPKPAAPAAKPSADPFGSLR